MVINEGRSKRDSIAIKPASIPRALDPSRFFIIARASNFRVRRAMKKYSLRDFARFANAAPFEVALFPQDNPIENRCSAAEKPRENVKSAGTTKARWRYSKFQPVERENGFYSLLFFRPSQFFFPSSNYKHPDPIRGSIKKSSSRTSARREIHR